MEAYSKIQRKIIAHPSDALDDVRRFINRHTKRENTCLKCGCIWGQHIHHTTQSWVRNFRCIHCKKTYSEFFWTILFWSKLKPSEWLQALLELSTATGGISGSELGRKIGRSRKTGWKILSNIRISLSVKRSMDQRSIDQSVDCGMDKSSGSEGQRNHYLFRGETEADEAWFWRKENQEIIVGIIQREPRRVYIESIPDVKERTLWPIVKKTIQPKSLFCTDMRISYSIAGIHYHHATTNHSKKEFGHKHINKEWKELMIHSNTIEQLWWQFKGAIRTIHHWVSKKYRITYLHEQIIRYEHWKTDNLYYYFLSLLFIPTFRGT